jgi:hypothetical protein
MSEEKRGKNPKVKIVQGEVLPVKDLYLGKVSAECPYCGEVVKEDNYLSYPLPGEWQEYYLYHQAEDGKGGPDDDGDHQFFIELKLNLNVEVR